MRRVIRGELGIIDVDAIVVWNRKNNTAKKRYYTDPFESEIQNEKWREADLNDPPVPDVDPRDPERPYARRLLSESIKRSVRDGTELYDG